MTKLGPPKVTKRRDFNNPVPAGLVLNRKELTHKKFKDIALQHASVEYLYLRENEFDVFEPYIQLPNLKILDLSINNLSGSVDFLCDTPILRHLYLTGNKVNTLSGICGLHHLETLCLSDNNIPSFLGLDGLPNLRVLSLNFNHIATFEHFPHLPSLHTLNLVGNPLVDIPSYRGMAIALANINLVSIDGKPVTEEERVEVEHYRGKIVYCIAGGFVAEGDNTEEAADKFMIALQRTSQQGKPLKLEAIRILSSTTESNVLTEGVAAQLSACMQDSRAYDSRTTNIFYSRYIFPVTFKVCGEATEVFVVGSMNGWGEPIALERCHVDNEIFFHTTLYLPPGDYEYRYIVDGVQKVTEQNKITSRYKQDLCNLYHVTEAQHLEDDQDTILYIRWMRSDRNNGFTLIENENSMSYTPMNEDIGCCLRAEVLAYVAGDFSFLYFDISTPVQSGPPRCTKIDILGNIAEGDVLKVEAHYTGGIEGESTLAWFRVSDAGEEEAIETEDPWAGYELTLEDIGKRILATFTPVRNDWTAGAPETIMTSIVAAGVPLCRSIKVVGTVMQDHELFAVTLYSGGVEGNSKFQWFRHDDPTGEYHPIPGEITPKYSPSLHDVGRLLAVEYFPLSREGVEGEVCRCILERPVEPAPPILRSISIKGDFEEGHVLMVDYDYHGGYFGSHQIQWFRREDSKRTTKIGRPNSATLTLTSKEVGHVIELNFTPVRADGVAGKMYVAHGEETIRPALPQLKSINFVGEPAQGNILEVVAEYFGGEQGDSVIVWSRGAAESRNFDVIAKKTKKYVVQQEDVGRMLKLSYTPVRKDGVHGEPKVRLIEIPALVSPPVPQRVVDPVTLLQVPRDANDDVSAPLPPQDHPEQLDGTPHQEVL